MLDIRQALLLLLLLFFFNNLGVIMHHITRVTTYSRWSFPLCLRKHPEIHPFDLNHCCKRNGDSKFCEYCSGSSNAKSSLLFRTVERHDPRNAAFCGRSLPRNGQFLVSKSEYLIALCTNDVATFFTPAVTQTNESNSVRVVWENT